VGRRWTWVAWSMLAIFLVGVGVGLPLMVANGDFQRNPAQQASLLLAFTAFMVMGAVLVAHRPANAIGWIFSAVGLLTGTGLFAWQYAEYAYLTRGSPLPGAMLGAWYNNWFGTQRSPCRPCSRSWCFPPAGCCRPAGAPSPG
jgi:hypothetical protein